MAVAALSCSKTEVALEGAQSEITVSPVASSITKTAITDGFYPQTNHIALFAFHAPGVPAATSGLDYSKFTETYLYNTEYYYTGEDNSTRIWAGLKSSYYWPITGSLVFAGYSLPQPEDGNTASTPIGTVTYDLSSDKLKIVDYVQSHETENTFDLLYFGRTAGSYNNRRNGEPIQLDFKHALSWIQIQAAGEDGTQVSGRVWSITDVTLKSVDTKGTMTYLGTSAADNKVTWSDRGTPQDISVFSGNKTLSDSYEPIENEEDGLLVIPQGAKKLSVTVAYKTPAGSPITEVVDIDLGDYTDTDWQAGYRYTYKLSFDPKQILVSPSVESWPDPSVTAPLPL